MGRAAVLWLPGVPIPVLVPMWHWAGVTRAFAQEAMMSFTKVAPLAALVGLGLLTAACGNNPTDRALTGGAIGAGTGAVVGSTVGAPIAGAVVGGAAGAVVGAATTPEQPRYYRY